MPMNTPPSPIGGASQRLQRQRVAVGQRVDVHDVDHRHALVDEPRHDAVDVADVPRRAQVEARAEHQLADVLAHRHRAAADVDVRLDRLALGLVVVQLHPLVDVGE